MNGIILDNIQEGDSTCYLIKCLLNEFVTSLSDDYKDYEVQREIVNNTYLDNLIDTVLLKKHIPPIVLVVDQKNIELEDNKVKINSFKILDGLQRTYRLKLIWDSLQFFKTELCISNEILKQNRLQLSRKYSEKLNVINSNSKILELIVQYYNRNVTENVEFDVDVCFNTFQWFEVWVNLKPQEEVYKMLILNAGHKPVKTQHQLELLFLNLIPIIKKTDLNDFELFREKESNSTMFSKNRKEGQFHFSHIITSLLSLIEGKPITANVNLVQKTQSSEYDTDLLNKYFNYEFLYEFVKVLLELDKAVFSHYKDIGTKWLGREVSLVGIFAALGKYGEGNSISPLALLKILNEKIVNNPTILNLTDFEKVRNSLDLSKINIGTANKNAIYNGLLSILNDKETSITWVDYFKGQVL